MDTGYDFEDKLRGCEEHPVLLSLIPHGYYTNLGHAYFKFEAICDLPQAILENSDGIFTMQDEWLFQNCLGSDDMPESLEERISRIESALKGSFVLCHPYYQIKQKPRGESFLRCHVYDAKKGFSVKAPEGIPEFLVIPTITKEQKEDLENGIPISIYSWDASIFGAPQYLIFEHTLLRVDLMVYEGTSYTYSAGDDGILASFDFSFPVLQESNKLIRSDDSPNGTSEDYGARQSFKYIFLQKSVLGTLQKKEEPKPLPTEIVQEEEIIDAIEEEKPSLTTTEEVLDQLSAYLKAKRLCYYPADIQNFHACVRAGVMTILAGMSGTGKTRLPLEYASFFNMSAENGTLLFITVTPSFAEPSDLLGFYSPAVETSDGKKASHKGYYVPSETGFVSFLKHAEENPGKMHMVIFDEMNLSQIEYWFAPFLSLMELDIDKRVLPLYDEHLECENGDAFPAKIRLGDNLIFIGTINLDETTKDLSDRLIDRSFILNLHKQKFELVQQQNSDDRPETPVAYKGKDLRDLIPPFHKNGENYIRILSAPQIAFFDNFDELLRKADGQKGVSYRAVRNICLYLQNAVQADGKGQSNEAGIEDTGTAGLAADAAFDFAVSQTILKKIKGGEETLGALLSLPSETNPIIKLFDTCLKWCRFENCRKIIEEKANELKRYGYVR